jgi:plasmid maintenance system killer protein
MKKIFTIAVITLASLVSFKTIAQPLVKKIALDNSYMLTQADSIKSAFEKDGFELSKSSIMVMESNNELPVIVSLKANTNYRIVFIADNTSDNSELKLSDFNDKLVVAKKSSGNSNIITYNYAPLESQYHMIKPIQDNKRMNQLNGYFMIFKKG